MHVAFTDGYDPFTDDEEDDIDDDVSLDGDDCDEETEERLLSVDTDLFRSMNACVCAAAAPPQRAVCGSYHAPSRPPQAGLAVGRLERLVVVARRDPL